MNLKDLKKLSGEVSKATIFVEQIQTKVQNDLSKISQLNTLVTETKTTIVDLEAKLKNANSVLSQLDGLLRGE